MPKILVIRLSSMGDVVLTTPVLRCLKEQLPNAEIHFLTKDRYLDAIKGNRHLTKIYTFTNDLRKVTRKLKRERYDYIIDLHKNMRSAYIKMKLNRKSYTYNKVNWQKWLYTQFRINNMPEGHLVDRYMEAVEPLGIKNDGKGLDFHVRTKDKIDIHTLPEFLHHGYIALIIGGTYFTKKLPNHKLISIINKLEKPVILIGGEDDQINARFIVENTNKKVYNSCGIYKIPQSASLIEQADYVITHDTGMMHIAAALKKPIVSIWGNTTPELGMSPYYGDLKISQHVFEIKGLSCRPCSKIGHKSCPKKHFKCMELIETSKIAQVVNSND